MQHIPLVLAMLTASQPMSATIPPSYLEVCFTMENHYHATCGLAREDWLNDGAVQFFVEESALDEFLALPWHIDEFPNVTIDTIDLGTYNDRRANNTFSGLFFDFRGARRGNVTLTSWGDVALGDGPTSFEIRTQDQTISTNGGPPQTPRMFVDSRLTAGDNECAVGVMGGFMKGAATYGVAGAGGGATLGALVGGLGAGPGAVAGAALLGAWGAVAGSLEAAADHCYGGNDKPDKQEDAGQNDDGKGNEGTSGDSGSDDSGSDDSGGDDSGSDGSDSGDSGETGGGEMPTGGAEPEDSTPNPNDTTPTEDSEEAIGTLGLGGRPLLDPMDKIDTLIGREEPKREASVRLIRPMQLPRDWEILHDSDPSDWLPVDLDQFRDGPITSPKDPPPQWRK